MIETLDLESGKIANRFSREYERVKHQTTEGEDKFVKKYKAPGIKFERDIEALCVSEGMLWVKTSTLDDEKGKLLELFNHDGIFVDSFFIDIKGRILCVDREFIYFSVSDEDYLTYIAKYKIDENIGPSQ